MAERGAVAIESFGVLLDELGVSVDDLHELPALAPEDWDVSLCSYTCGLTCISPTCGNSCNVTSES